LHERPTEETTRSEEARPPPPAVPPRHADHYRERRRVQPDVHPRAAGRRRDRQGLLRHRGRLHRRGRQYRHKQHGWPNATRVYTQAVNITNGDAGSRTFSIAFDSWSGDTGQVGSLLIKVFDDGGSQQGSTVTVGTPSSATGDISIGTGDEYSLQIEVLWTAGSQTLHDVSFTLTMTVNDE
jgi:hypothetical protein